MRASKLQGLSNPECSSKLSEAIGNWFKQKGV